LKKQNSNLLLDKNELSRRQTSLQAEADQFKLQAEKQIFELNQQVQSGKQELVDSQQKSARELDDTKNIIAQKDKLLRESLSALTTLQEKVKQLEKDGALEREKYQKELQSTEFFRQLVNGVV